jgi:uncharacterized membrane protein YeiB
LGDCIIQLVGTARDTSFHDFLFLFLQFGVVFNLGDIYYQQQIVGKHLFHLTKAHKSPYLWAMLHMSLSLTILYFSAAIKLLNTDYEEEHEDHEAEDHHQLQQQHQQELQVGALSSHTDSFHDEKYLCACMTISLLLIYLMRMQHKGLRDEGKLRLRKWSYAFKLILSILCSGVPWVAKTPTQCVAYLFTITGLLIIQDLVSHEGHLRVEDDHESDKNDAAIEDHKTFFERYD